MLDRVADDSLDLGLYLQRFKGREEYFAEQGEGRYAPIHKVLDEFYLRRHLEGDATFGLYVLNRESCCHLVCIDLDIPKSELARITLDDPAAKHQYLRPKLDAVLGALTGVLRIPHESILIEETGGRGYHVWLFFSGPVRGQSAVSFGRLLKSHLDFEIEFFPKQGELKTETPLGNLIKPCCLT